MRFTEPVLLSDFDETIVNIDTAEFALEHFADPSWKRIEKQFETGAISFEESLRQEFALITAPENVLLAELDKVAVLRPNFEKLIEYCKDAGIRFTVVSGGLEFCIRHFLSQKEWLQFLEIYAPKVKYTGAGYEASFPKLLDSTSINFKQDLVRHEKRQGHKVFYIGDGLGDLPPAKEADYAFAIKGSKLAEGCRNQSVRHGEFTDFEEVIKAIRNLEQL